MGLGRFGGGVGATRYLLEKGMSVIVTDLCRAEQLTESIARITEFDGPGDLELMLGTHEDVPFTDADLVVASPAIPSPWSNSYLQAARLAKVPVCTEIELFLDRIDHRKLIAVTGSSGKSSTCAMIHHVLRESGRQCILGGNLGGSLLGYSQSDLDESDVVVLELSSFMLHWIGESASLFQPATAALTTLSSNHLDWHETAKHYVQCKQILMDAVVPGNLVLPLESDAIAPDLTSHLDLKVALNERADRSWDEEDEQRALLDSINLMIPGPHQQYNAAAALRLVACHLDSAPARRRQAAIALAPTLDSFPGLPHRLKPLPGFSGVRVIDDSKSTTPESALKAVEAFESPESIHLIAGGFDKGSDLSEVDRLGDVLAGLYAIGATSPKLLSGKNATECGTLEEAVRVASSRMHPGQILLLSPGCASWDQFENYEARGRAFEEAARRSLQNS